jgi:hypothetical protein
MMPSGGKPQIADFLDQPPEIAPRRNAMYPHWERTFAALETNVSHAELAAVR